MNRTDRVESAANGGKRKGFSQTYEAPHSEYIPPPPDEAYWAALLYEGEDGGMGFSEAPDGERPTVGMSPDSAEEDWIAAEKIFEADGTVELTVNGANRGGLLVEWNSLRGFVPASQLVDFPATTDPRIRKGQLALYIGQLLRLRIIEFDKPNNRL